MNIIEQARKIKAAQDARDKRLNEIKNLVEGMGKKPSIAEFFEFLKQIRKAIKS